MPNQPAMSLPDTLRPYAAHGLELNTRGGREATADCVWCLSEDKLSINVERGVWRCNKCGEGGNALKFVRMLWEKSYEETTVNEYLELKEHRQLLWVETLVHWQLAKSCLRNCWLIPCFDERGAFHGCYRYNVRVRRPKALATPGSTHGLHGMNLWNKDRPVVYLCEGPWDGIMLYELLLHGTPQFEPTLSHADSMLLEANVLAVPGCGVFPREWCSLFRDKIVVLMYDNDHDRPDGKGGAGRVGMERVSKVLSGSGQPPQRILFLRWGGAGDRLTDPGLPDGYDLRDYVQRRRPEPDAEDTL